MDVNGTFLEKVDVGNNFAVSMENAHIKAENYAKSFQIEEYIIQERIYVYLNAEVQKMVLKVVWENSAVITKSVFIKQKKFVIRYQETSVQDHTSIVENVYPNFVVS